MRSISIICQRRRTLARQVAAIFANGPAIGGNLQAAARNLGLRIHVIHASTERDIDGAFATLIQSRVAGLLIASDPFFQYAD
jgi:hypothetical protein